MAILTAPSSRFSASSSSTTVLRAILGWSVSALFGRLSNTRATILSAVLVASLFWPVLLLGVAFPAVSAWVFALLSASKMVRSGGHSGCVDRSRARSPDGHRPRGPLRRAAGGEEEESLRHDARRLSAHPRLRGGLPDHRRPRPGREGRVGHARLGRRARLCAAQERALRRRPRRARQSVRGGRRHGGDRADAPARWTPRTRRCSRSSRGGTLSPPHDRGRETAEGEGHRSLSLPG